MAETFTPPTNTSYSAVFDIVRTWLGLAEFKAERTVLDSLARNIAADMCRRDLAPAAYGDKRRPHYTHAAIGCDGVSVNLCLRDGSAEFVFREEELDFIREDGRDLYVAHVASSEILALRQSLIDYLPAAEAVEDRAVPAPPSLEAMKAAVELEIKAAIGAVTTRGIGELIDRVAEARVQEALAREEVALAAMTAPTDREVLRKTLTEITDAADKLILSLPGHWHDDATIELTDAANDARVVLSAAAQNDLYDVSKEAARG